MKRLALILLTTLLLTGCGTTTPTQSSQAAYVASSTSAKFHRPDCQWAHKISAGNKITFSTREEAIKKGYEPCKVCRP
ncbi:MAG: nuclease [Firmicutes bacterium]|nr:nuclease [Bacillota bacterium]